MVHTNNREKKQQQLVNKTNTPGWVYPEERGNITVSQSIRGAKSGGRGRKATGQKKTEEYPMCQEGFT